MSFNSLEISTQDGRPLALYLLEWGETEWCYTSGDRDVTYGVDRNGDPRIYQAEAVSDDGMVQGGSSQNDFTLHAPAEIPLVELFRRSPPSETVWLTVRRMHYGEPDAPIYWSGTINNVKRVNDAEAEIIGRPLSASFKRTGLRLCWSRECPHFLYDTGCKVNPELHKVEAVVIGVTGNTVTVDGVGANPDSHFKGGFMSWSANSDGTVERRMLESQVGTLLTVFGTTERLTEGDVVSLYPGCDRSPTICDEKFDNLDNFGGFPFMPGESPFGTVIF